MLLIGLLISLVASQPSNPMEPCNWNGFFYPDEALCECMQCFNPADNCSTTLDDCVIGDGAGNPKMYQEVIWSAISPNASANSPPWLYSPYAACMPHCEMLTSAPEKSLKGIQKALLASILALHDSVGNIDTKDKTIVYAHGATELIMAAQWAHAQLSPNKMATVFAQKPYYPGYPTPSTVLQELTFSSSLNLTQSDNIIEMLAYPNNPDGQMRAPVYNTSRVIHDMVYYWPHLIPESKGAMLDFDVMWFSMSKLSGHAGSRFGYAFVRDPVFAAKMQEFIAATSLHVSVDSTFRAIEILNYITETGPYYFQVLKGVFEQRWTALEKVLSGSNRFTQLSRPNTFYPWIRCDLEADVDCTAVFASVGVRVAPGDAYGATSRFVRLEMVQYSQVFSMMLERIEKLV